MLYNIKVYLFLMGNHFGAEDINKYRKFKKVDGATYRKVNQFLRKRTYITAREWAIARLCTDFRTKSGAEMTFIGQHLPELVPFMRDVYTPQAVNQARNSFKKKVYKSGATFFYGAMCGFFTTDELDDLLFEASEVARFLLEVERTSLEIDEEIDIEDRITNVMRSVGEAAKVILRAREELEAAGTIGVVNGDPRPDLPERNNSVSCEEEVREVTVECRSPEGRRTLNSAGERVPESPEGQRNTAGESSAISNQNCGTVKDVRGELSPEPVEGPLNAVDDARALLPESTEERRAEAGEAAGKWSTESTEERRAEAGEAAGKWSTESTEESGAKAGEAAGKWSTESTEESGAKAGEAAGKWSTESTEESGAKAGDAARESDTESGEDYGDETGEKGTGGRSTGGSGP